MTDAYEAKARELLEGYDIGVWAREQIAAALRAAHQAGQDSYAEQIGISDSLSFQLGRERGRSEAFEEAAKLFDDREAESAEMIRALAKGEAK